MKRLFAFLLYAIIALSAFKATDISGIIDSLKSKMATYQSERPFVNLYVHLDKNIYLTNESIWFKAYLLTAHNPDNKVLFVRLTDKNKKVVLSYQFPMYDIRAHGDVALPDSLKEGDYYFYAYTNIMVNNSPDQVFVQKIKVFENAAEDMQAEAGVTDSSKLHRGGNVDILIKLKKNGRYVTDAKGSYQLMVDDKAIKTARISTNFLGEAFISFTYPQLADDQTLQVKAKFNKNADNAVLNLNLRHEASPVLVNVYPEDGHLIEGISNRCTVEAGDNRNNPLATTLLFKSGSKLIATLKTNKYGLATLNFKPQAGVDYHFEVPGNSNKTPTVLSNKIEVWGYSLQVTHVGGKIFASIANTGKADSALLVLRTHNKILWHQDINLKNGDSTKIELPVNSYPKQIFSIALFDSQSNCIAERLLQNKPDEDCQIEIATDKPSYGQRQKVKVMLNARYLNGTSIPGNLSIAVVEKTRINTESYVSILDAYYCKALSASFPDQHYSGATAAEMDAILLTKHWHQNTWDVVFNYKPRGTVRLIKNVDGVTGKVDRIDHKPVELKQLLIYSKIKGFRAVPINSDGSFVITASELTGERTDNEYLVLDRHFYDSYKITMANFEKEYDGMVQFADAMRFLEPYNSMVKLNDKTGLNLKGTVQLHEVKIAHRLTEEQQLKTGVYRSTNCNDFVCENHVLNCPNHKKGFPPVEGGRYHYRGYFIIYYGCGNPEAANHPLLKKISLPYDFLLPDYDKEPSAEPELRSTIYWNPNINTDKSGKVSFEFYTSDIKGDFTVIVQGIAIGSLRPIMGTKGFTVK